ncbi:hypothetical protein BDY24DRAFT_383504 [Mrakia frigida]|uniref:heat shock factor-binding 1 family protein n=1 Tax=Mrakia frigida TaxID=29902 RepID=UPI003FCC0E1C
MSMTTKPKVPPTAPAPASALSLGSKSTSSGGVGKLKEKEKTVGEISSPVELMTFVDSLLGQLEDKFSETSKDVLDRMTTMSTRIDTLESSINEILNGAITGSGVAPTPASPSPAGASK